MQYLIPRDEPFKGWAQSILLPDGTVAYSGGLTVEEYEAERGLALRIISSDELDALILAHTESLITAPQEETREAWLWALECLPPCRWRRVQGIEIFHISERITGDLVAWHCAAAGRFFTFTDRAGKSAEAIAAKVIAAL